MRESEIRYMQKENAARSGLILAQAQFLDTRLRAIETAFSGASLFDRISWIINPKLYWNRVDSINLRLFDEERKKMAAAAEKAKEESMKPKITIISPNGNGVAHV